MPIIRYNSLAETKQAKLRTAPNHLLGWEPKHTTKLRNGKYEIDWATPTDPRHSSKQIDPQQTEKNRLRVLRQKILDDTITERELVEYERLKIQLGI